MALHIGISDSEGDLELISKAISGEQVANWYVPKTAEVDDQLAIYLHGQGIIASGTIAQPPIKADKAGYYASDLKDVSWVTPPMTLNDMRSRFPNWNWPTYPRSYTTPPPEIQTSLESFIDSRKNNS